jgi:hypothetical protein
VEELQKAKASLEAETGEQRRELDVSENDKTVLRDALKQVEEEKNGLALDLAETSKVCQQITKLLAVVSAIVLDSDPAPKPLDPEIHSGPEQLRIRNEFEVKRL